MNAARNILLKFLRQDWLMTACVIALIALGAVFIDSAGSFRQSRLLQNLWRVHLQTAVVGFALYYLLAELDYRKLFSWFATPFYAVSTLMLIVVLVFGAERFGGRRWLWFFQPSEIAKLAVIVFTAEIFGHPGRESAKWLAVALAALGIPSLLILAEPDLGTTLVLVPAVCAMLLAARVWLKGLVTLLVIAFLAAGAVLGSVYVAEKTPDPERRAKIYRVLPLREHQLKRLRVFIFPDQDITGAGYNRYQAQISIGSGGLWGKGIKKGDQKALGYLPPTVALNDFIFAVLGEEGGFVCAILMLALFLGVLMPCVRIAVRATDDRGRLVVIGISMLVFCHLYENVAMSIGLMPVTGLPLPFISAGRTFLVILMAALGIVQSVNIHREQQIA